MLLDAVVMPADSLAVRRYVDGVLVSGSCPGCDRLRREVDSLRELLARKPRQRPLRTRVGFERLGVGDEMTVRPVDLGMTANAVWVAAHGLKARHGLVYSVRRIADGVMLVRRTA